MVIFIDVHTAMDVGPSSAKAEMEPHLFSAQSSQWVTWYNHVCNSPPRLPGLLLYAMSIVPEAILPQVHTEYTSVFQAVAFPGTYNSQKLYRRISLYYR